MQNWPHSSLNGYVTRISFLPVRRGPVNSMKLSLTNCEPLIHQIKTKFSSWPVKSLLFFGRLLLIKTLIAEITTFWCSAFVLPKSCIAVINSLCSQFLWKGSLKGHNTARVSWETVCVNKETRRSWRGRSAYLE